MKNLVFKEFKLAMHPVCYCFVLLFPFMILIPSYPLSIGFLYVLTAYPILFLGANKGQQTNDLLFTTLLPVRKKDIVLARILTVGILQFTFIALTSCLLPLGIYINSLIPVVEGVETVPGLGFDSYLSLIAIVLIGYAIADIIFFPMYYKSVKSIVLPTLLAIFAFVICIGIFAIFLPLVPGLTWYTNIVSGEIWIQIILLVIALIIYGTIHWLIYKISSKRLEKIDF